MVMIQGVRAKSDGDSNNARKMLRPDTDFDDEHMYKLYTPRVFP